MGRSATITPLATQRRKIYIALEELDFVWDENDVTAFDRMWEMGWDCSRIAEELERDPDEVAILAMDRIRQNRIHPRHGGWFGTKREEK